MPSTARPADRWDCAAGSCAPSSDPRLTEAGLLKQERQSAAECLKCLLFSGSADCKNGKARPAAHPDAVGAIVVSKLCVLWTEEKRCDEP